MGTKQGIQCTLLVMDKIPGGARTIRRQMQEELKIQPDVSP